MVVVVVVVVVVVCVCVYVSVCVCVRVSVLRCSQFVFFTELWLRGQSSQLRIRRPILVSDANTPESRAFSHWVTRSRFFGLA